MDDFKFKIGDRVTVSEAAREAERLNAALKPDAYARYDKPLMVVRHRHLDECYGGVQRHYDCRIIQIPSKTVGNMTVGFSAQDVGGLLRVQEPEMELYGESD